MNHTIQIEKIVHGGLGLARLESGIVALTPHVLPGESVEVQEKEIHRGFIKTEPVRILQPSKDRITPVCQYYGQCGGCDFQHISQDAQHQIKEDIVRESLIRAGITFDDHILKPIIPSPHALHYRFRIRLKISPQGEIGYYEAGSHAIVEIGYCHVATSVLNKALAELRESSFIKDYAVKMQEIELLQSPADKKVFCLITPKKGEKLSKEVVRTASASFQTLNGFAVKKGRHAENISMKPPYPLLQQHFDASICGHPYSLQWTPGCFSQVNAEQNSRLIQYACQLTGETPQNIVDLFCGMGNFSIPLTLRGDTVTGIERSSESITQARNNALKNGLSHAVFHDLDVHKWIRKAAKKQSRYDVIFVDPPRQGIGRDSILLADISRRKIIYISCDPATLARDIALLTNNGFRLASLTPVDMFPQTHHIESVALLEKI